jgi:hypothetical protein
LVDTRSDTLSYKNMAHNWTQVEPDNWRFGGGASDTVLHPIVIVALVVTIIIMLCLPRKFSLPAFFLSTFLIPAGQQVLLGGLHVYVYRLVVISGLMRMVCTPRSPKGNRLAGGWNSIDTAFFLYVGFHAASFVLLNADNAAIINQIGFIWDFIGGYVLLRHLIHNQLDVTRTIKWFAYLALLFALCMVREQMTGENIFGALGGVRFISQVREGRIRSEAVFQHPLLAGTFAATLVPLFIGLWRTGQAKWTCVLGVIATGVMVLASACSTPVMAYGAGVTGLVLWPFRRYMRLFRWALGTVLLGLHLSMNAPVWALIQRIDVVQGGSSYHRYVLVDQFIRHWSDWYLIGTNSNAEWGAFTFDSANQYVAEGTTGGLLALTFFILQIVWGFKKLGGARTILELQDRRQTWFIWALGASLFAHVIGFFGISYFDQTRVGWFALLAIICATTSNRVVRSAKLPASMEGAERVDQSEPNGLVKEQCYS